MAFLNFVMTNLHNSKVIIQLCENHLFWFPSSKVQSTEVLERTPSGLGCVFVARILVALYNVAPEKSSKPGQVSNEPVCPHHSENSVKEIK